MLDPPEIWVGYAPRREGIQELVADPDALERLARHASKSTRLIAVTPKG